MGERQIGAVVLEETDERYTIRIDLDRVVLEEKAQKAAGSALMNWLRTLLPNWIRK
ncbi:hypothetical protein ABMY26_06635 (plasmid) [Azospirillum sp. HJ39]|uniref:hypothetical protein n=1 Tax=Azospirillum sp. HJ39 TaxID=3159496 RepID=UPI00355924B0